MKAVILAAGKGERLKDVTAQIPKPMIEFEGKPVLAHNIELCARHNIRELFLNLHHLPEKITEHFGNGSGYNVTISYSLEQELLGTAGAVRKIADDYWNTAATDSAATDDENYFFVIYGDNYSAYDLELVLRKIIATRAIGVIAFHYREDTEHSGVAEFTENGKIVRFVEKPKPGESESHWVNAGIYCFDRHILDYIPAGVSDFARDIFPHLLQLQIPLYGVCEHIEVKAFDTPEMYRKSFNA